MRGLGIYSLILRSPRSLEGERGHERPRTSENQAKVSTGIIAGYATSLGRDTLLRKLQSYILLCQFIDILDVIKTIFQNYPYNNIS